MNVDDLRQTLSTMAKEVDPSPSAPLLRAVEAKVTSARRQRLGAGLGVVAAAAVLGLVVPHLVDGGDAPPVASQTKLPTVEDRGVSFYSSPAGNTLVGEKVGDPGQRSVTLRVTPRTTDLSYQSVCLQAGDASGGLVQSVTINGKAIAGESCNQTGQPVDAGSRFGFSPAANRHFWRHDVGVVPGRPMTLRVSLRPGVPTGSSPIQLGIALYAMTGPMISDQGLWVGRQAVFAGHTYELATREISRIDGRHGRISLALPSSDQRLYLRYGVADVHSGYRSTADGSGFSAEGGTGSGSGRLSRPGQTSSHLSIHILGDKPGAVLYILAYRQLD